MCLAVHYVQILVTPRGSIIGTRFDYSAMSAVLIVARKCFPLKEYADVCEIQLPQAVYWCT